MQLLFSRNKVIGVADRWRSIYPENRKLTTGDSQDKYERLVVCGPEITPDQAAQIIGNKSWSHYSCNECGQDQDRVVALRDGHHELYICPSCARAVAALACAVLP